MLILPMGILFHADRRPSPHIGGYLREIFGNHRKQLFPMSGQYRQPYHLHKCDLGQRFHLPAETPCLAGYVNTDILQFSPRVVRLHELDKGLNQGILPTGAPQQVVDVVEALGQVILFAPSSTTRDLNDAPFDEAGELGAALARLQPGTDRNLPRSRWLPQISEHEIDSPLLRWE